MRTEQEIKDEAIRIAPAEMALELQGCNNVSTSIWRVLLHPMAGSPLTTEDKKTLKALAKEAEIVHDPLHGGKAPYTT